MSQLRPDEPPAARILRSHDEVLAAWRADGASPAAALDWTRRQVEAFRDLVTSEDGWESVQRSWAAGRGVDSWLATDWPEGFDELLLCVPLCRLVAFECARCTIGARQAAMSCAHPRTVFGRTAVHLASGDRHGLVAHLDQVLRMLDPQSSDRWDLDRACSVPAGD